MARRGNLYLDARLEVASGEMVVLLGPNGAGKTTLLRALAGLVELIDGRVVLDGEVLEEPGAGRRVRPEHRSVGFVFQDNMLFPHLTVLENVAFGLRARGTGRASARARAAGWLERMGLEGCARARPGALSGGQAQRVALARALATEPALLLLDEPLSALDAGARVEVRRELRRHLDSYEGSRLLVTHDALEAVALADRMIVIEGGRVAQSGSPDELRARPRSRYVADLVGLNLFRGRAAGGLVELSSGVCLVTPGAPTGEVFAAIHPRSVALYRSPPQGSPRNVWEGEIRSLDSEQDRVRVAVAGPERIVAEVTPEAAAELELPDGGRVYASMKATDITVYRA